MRKRLIVVAGATLALTLSLSACGQRGETGGTASTTKKVVKIGFIAPVSGSLSAMGLGMKNSVDLAINQANQANAIPGWTIELEALDDEAKPETGKNAATKLAGDDAVIGVVGTLNSSVAAQVAPVLQPKSIVMVSPANTSPTLTRGESYATNPTRLWDNFFRVCATDDVQGPFAARYLLDQGITSVATVHDKKTYGQGLVEAFTKEYTAKGGSIVTAETLNPDESDFSAVVTKVKASNPQAVYYGGEYPQSGPLAQQLKNAGVTVPLMSGDGTYDPKFIELAGTAANGSMATSVGAPIESLASAKDFVAAYNAAGYKESYSAYGAQSYDAAQVIIKAAATTLASATDVVSARKPTVAAVAKTSFDGATGAVSFDQWGDPTVKILTVYQVKDNAWVAIKTGS